MKLIIQDKQTNTKGGVYPQFDNPLFHGLLASGEYIIVQNDGTTTKFLPNTIDNIVTQEDIE